MRATALFALFAAAPLALAACSGKSDEDIARENNSYLPADAPPTAKERPIVLDALAAADFAERLGTGEICRFTGADGRLLFAASAAADAGEKGRGLLKLAGDFRTLRADRIGGADLLRQGGAYGDGNVTAAVQGGGTGTATLEVSISDGNSASFDGGQWRCGV